MNVNSFILQQNIPNAQLILYRTPITARNTNIPNYLSAMSQCSWRNRAAARDRFS